MGNRQSSRNGESFCHLKDASQSIFLTIKLNSLKISLIIKEFSEYKNMNKAAREGGK